MEIINHIMAVSLYPPAPVLSDEKVLLPSASFRKQTTRVIGAILLFFCVYLLLLGAALAIGVGSMAAGIYILTLGINGLIVLVSGGLVAMGLAVIVFVVKFIFAGKKTDNDHIVITEAEQPELFAFIRRLTEETNTRFPKKIEISPDVNAAVYYDSSFWSMFLPVRKNLIIGMGLVNSVNISEFKAIMAHEFGHFSQRSMKLGSFTYNVNRVIYDMLYENDGYNKFLRGMAGLHSVVAVFTILASKIARAIQYILKDMYKLVNKQYMGLSREMEFHADTIAAAVAGGNNAVSGLVKVSIGGITYAKAIGMANEMLPDKKITANIYDNQLLILAGLVDKYNLQLTGSLSAVPTGLWGFDETSRILYKDQWASHPTFEERKANITALNLYVAPDETPAIRLFANPDALQQRATRLAYAAVNTEELTVCPATEFAAQWEVKDAAYTVPPQFDSFYKFRVPRYGDWDFDAILASTPMVPPHEIFSEANAQIATAVRRNKADIQTLEAIIAGEIDVRTFDFEGQRYNSAEAAALKQKLEQELAADTAASELLDKQLFCYYYQQNNATLDYYKDMAAVINNANAYTELVNKVIDLVNTFYGQQVPIEKIQHALRAIRESHNEALKTSFRESIDKGVVTAEWLKQDLAAFIDGDYQYFNDEMVMAAEVNHMIHCATSLVHAWNLYEYSQHVVMLEKLALAVPEAA